METSESSSASFPHSLLEQPVQERLQYFEKLVVSHKRLKERLVKASGGASLIAVLIDQESVDFVGLLRAFTHPAEWHGSGDKVLKFLS